jgi:glycosyltransferase involved in cell wall biosynthesis
VVRVLHIHTLPVISGSGLNTFLSMRGLNKGVYETALACAPGGKLIPLVRSQSMRVITFKNLVQPLHPVKDALAVINLTLFMKKNPYHIVHTHNSKAGFVGRLSAKLAGVPVIVHTVHGFSFHDKEPTWRQWLFRNAERLASHWCDCMIFISQPLVDWALKERIANHKKIVKIYSGIELDRFTPVTEEETKRLREKWGLGERDAVVGIVSKLWDGKGHALLIEAFREIRQRKREAKLLMVGEGYLLKSLRELVDKYKLNDAVVFTGFQAEVAQIIATFDVAVLPSLFEGMGRVVVEAMAMEKPVVASRVGGIPDLVEHGVNGYLVSPGDVKELEHAVFKLLNDPSLARRMGKEGRRKISNQFSAATMADSIDRVYRELLSRKGVSLDP